MSKHTPGPWETGEGKLDGGYLGVFRKGATDVICRVSPLNAMIEADVYNAHLIAAAPELLEALIKAEAVIKASTFPGFSTGFERDALDLIDAAIAKAEGGKNA